MPKQVTERQIEQLIEGLIDKMQKANELFLMNIGEKIKKIKKLRPSEAYKLVQILKYGGNYDDIVNKISKITNINIKKLDKMFEAYSKKDMKFAEDFYNYRNIPFAEYNKNSELKRQTEALANIAKQEMYDFSRSNVLGYTVTDRDGNEIFKGLRQAYNDLLDEAFINVGQGKETFDNSMRKIIKEIGTSGLKTLNYQSGRAVRLDSAIRMHLHNRLNELHNENQVLFGKQFDSDGIEISVHENPAPDHSEVQGRQFSNEEFDKLQNGEEAKAYNGKTYSLDHDGKNGYRPISEMNCYHTIFSIILGVSEPEYSDKQLANIKRQNSRKFEFEGKKYTKYEGTQLQRRIETQIRKEKDMQILAKASGSEELVAESQYNIKALTNKYNELSKVSKLPTKKQRMRVSEYKVASTAEFDNKVKMLYNIGTKEENAALYFKAKRKQQKIRTGGYNLNIIPEKQRAHNFGDELYQKGKSYFNLSIEEEQELVNEFAGTGYIPSTTSGNLKNVEICKTDKIIGKYINKNYEIEEDTNSFVIHYSKKGVHIVPANKRS